MSYKRVVKKKGKSYGPYIYESYRDEQGKVRKRYLGRVKEKKFSSNSLKFIFFIIGIFGLIFLLGGSYTTNIFFDLSNFENDNLGLFEGIYRDSLTGLNILDTSEDEKRREPEESEEESTKDSSLDIDEDISTGDEEDSSQDLEEVREVIETKDEERVEPEESTEDPSQEVNESAGEEGPVINASSLGDDLVNESSPKNEAGDSFESDSGESGGGGVINLSTNKTNISVLNKTKINKTILNKTLVNNTLSNKTEVPNITLLKTFQYKAIVGRPVKWIKKVNKTKDGLKVELPKDAVNISVLTNEEIELALTEAEDYEKKVEEVDREEIVSGTLTGQVSLDLKEENEGFLTGLLNWLRRFTISGRVIREENLVGKIIEETNSTIVDLEGIVADPNSTEIAVEYYTEAPQIAEEVGNRGKEIVVYSGDELNYTDILAYTTISDWNLSVGDTRLKLYWNKAVERVVKVGRNDSFLGNLTKADLNQTDSLGNGSSSIEVFYEEVGVDFISKDLDGDGFIDYIEWVVPHLSNQSYNLVIEIVAAEHLDVDREFISDIYNETIALDGNWSEPIYAGEYVRVTFKRKLSSENDITVYPRAGNGTNLSDLALEVYLFNGTEKIVNFPSFDSGERYYKTLLNGMNGTHDTFDLRVVSLSNDSNHSILFDHIIDPNSAPVISSLSVSSTSGYGTADDDLTVNIGASDLDNDSLYNVTDWRLNGVSIAPLNMPFNTNVSDSSSALVKDYSTSTNNGTLSGNTNPFWTNVSCQSGGCYNFDGTDDYIRVADDSSISGLNAVSVSLWINATAWLSSCGDGFCEERILQKGSFSQGDWEYMLYHYEDGGANDEIRWLVSSDGLDPAVYATYSVSGLVTGTWHHLVGTWDSNAGALHLYVDSTDQGEVSGAPAFMNDGNGNLAVGSSGDNGEGSAEDDFNGVIDEVMIFSRTLSSSEVIELYDSGAYRHLKTIKASETNGGENWSVAVTSSDTMVDSTTNLSSNITLLSTGINIWNCTSWQNFDNISCWTQSRVPNAGDTVVFNGTYTGNVNITNNTMPQGLASFTVESGYTGVIYFLPLFAKGNWTGNNDGTPLWNVTGDIKIVNGTMKIYGDYLHSDITGATGNISSDGHGAEWLSVSGNINISSGALIDGYGLGFPKGVGPGLLSSGGACYAGYRINNSLNGVCTDKIYGNASAPTSLGTGGANSSGGSSIKLDSLTGDVYLDGIVNMSGTSIPSVDGFSGTGGSVWIKGSYINGTGKIYANGGDTNQTSAGTGGRVRLGYVSSMNYTGVVDTFGGDGYFWNYAFSDPGTLTFTSNTWPSDWNVNGSVGLLGGNFGDGAVVNVLGNFVLDGGYTVEAYGDYVSSSNNWNTTTEGSGLWINASGNISILLGNVLDGFGNGFPSGTGPSPGNATHGGSYGGLGYLQTSGIYGSETEPTSLGSGGLYFRGGSAIRLQTKEKVLIGGIVSSAGYASGGAAFYGSTGGSLWVNSSEIEITGTADAILNSLGGGGRVALVGDNITIDGAAVDAYSSAGGGTIYINATGNVNITSSAVRAIGSLNTGGNSTIAGNRVLLNGTYQATGSPEGKISIYYEDCDLSDTSQATFDIDPVISSSSCDVTSPNLSFVKPSFFTGMVTSESTFDFNATTSDSSSNVTGFFDINNTVLGWWRMNDFRFGSLLVDEFGQNNGTAGGSPVEVSGGPFGSAMSFDGGEDDINLSNILSGYKDFAISAWIKTNTTGKIVSNKKDIVAFFDDFSTDKGWSGYGGAGEWERSAANSSPVSCQNGAIDPTTDHSPSGDNYMIGNDIGDCYSSGLTAPYNITSPSINCTSCSNTNLSFWRDLGVETSTWDHVYIWVYNGSSWVQIYTNPTSHVDDTSWTYVSYNVSNYSDGNDNFSIRFGMGTTDGSWQFSGWNIDDIRLAYDNSGYGQTDFYLSLNSLGNAEFSVYDSDGCGCQVIANGSTALNDSQWHHLLAFVNGKNDIWLYVDGVFVNTTAIVNPSVAPSDDIFMASEFYGEVDDVIFFSRTLFAGEITSLYDNGNKSRNLELTKSFVVDEPISYRAYTQDSSGNINSTALWNFYRDTLVPHTVDLLSPTPANNSILNNRTLPINVSANDSLTNVSIFVDLDNDSLGWWRMEEKINSTSNGTTTACRDPLAGNHEIEVDLTTMNSGSKFTFTEGPESGNTYTTGTCTGGQCIGGGGGGNYCCVLEGWTGCPGGGYNASYIYNFTDRNGTILKDYFARNNASSIALAETVEILGGRFGDSINITGEKFNVIDFSWNLTDSFSMAVWIWPDSLSEKGAIISKIGGYEYSFHVGTGDDVEFVYWNSSGTAILNLTKDGVLSLDSWYFIAMTYNGSYGKLFVDGVEVDNDSLSSGTFRNLAAGTIFGGGYYNTTDYGAFKGLIDNVLIFNRTLSDEEITGLYDDSLQEYLDTNITNLKSGDHVYRAYAQDLAGNINYSEQRNIQVNHTPENPVVEINSSLGLNRTAEDLHCNFTVIDSDGDNMTAWVDWIESGQEPNVLNAQVFYSQVNGTEVLSTLGSGNTSRGKDFYCQVTVGDGNTNSSIINSDTLTIVNTPPSVNLVEPADFSATTNRKPLFNWTASDDDSLDVLTYDWNLSEYQFSGSNVCNDDRTATGLSDSNYTPSTDLGCLHDNGYYYRWQVNVSDGADWTMSSVFVVNITAIVSSNLTVSSINFGNILMDGTNDTSDDSPSPFIIENDGNSFSNISLNSSSFWQSISGESSYYQFKVDNVSGEEGAFNWSGSTTSWFNISLTGAVVAVDYLNYSNATDSAEVDLRVQVPPNEYAGDRGATLVFLSELDE